MNQISEPPANDQDIINLRIFSTPCFYGAVKDLALAGNGLVLDVQDQPEIDCKLN